MTDHADQQRTAGLLRKDEKQVMIYSGQTGITYILESQLGAGGEGIVYSLYGNDQFVAKIYKKEKFHSDSERKTMERKLKTMISMNVPVALDGIIRLAWPQDILYDNHVMAGFIMPKIETTYKLFDIYRGGKNSVRAKLYPNYTWKYAAQFAYHLAWVVAHLHSRDIVIGDFNQNNIAVDPVFNTIILIDCDSFDITDPKTGEHFPCTVGLPEMLAPELQDVGSLSKGHFSKESDNFSLAIHIFRLLMDNADPFGGIITVDGSASVSDIPANRAIVNGECAYVRNVPGKRIPDWSPKMEMLPGDLMKLFKKTFYYTAVNAKRKKNNRATAKEWCDALKPLGAPEPNPHLKTCTHNRLHVYPAHNKTCPWCRTQIKKTTRISKRHRRYRYLLAGVVFLVAAGTAVMYLQGIHPVTAVQSWIKEIPTLLDSSDDSSDRSSEVLKETNAEETNLSEYIIPDSNSRYLTENDLEGLSQDEVCLARNEIFARYGRKFRTDWIRDYFLSTSWYEEQYEPDEFDAISNDIFNEYEKENIRIIVAYEAKMGYQ